MLKSKIHHATITSTSLDYIGSIFIDQDLLSRTDIKQFEKLEVYNLSNGKSWSTYAMPAPAGSGRIDVNGSAWHHCKPGDMINILAFHMTDEDEYPRMILVDHDNKFEMNL
jgi:aspartate 1-decarboxylase